MIYNRDVRAHVRGPLGRFFSDMTVKVEGKVQLTAPSTIKRMKAMARRGYIDMDKDGRLCATVFAAMAPDFLSFYTTVFQHSRWRPTIGSEPCFRAEILRLDKRHIRSELQTLTTAAVLFEGAEGQMRNYEPEERWKYEIAMKKPYPPFIEPYAKVRSSHHVDCADKEVLINAIKTAGLLWDTDKAMELAQRAIEGVSMDIHGENKLHKDRITFHL